MPHNKNKLKITELDEEWLKEQNLPAKCKCGKTPIWVVVVDSLGIAALSDRRMRTVGPFCNNCVIRQFSSS